MVTFASALIPAVVPAEIVIVVVLNTLVFTLVMEASCAAVGVPALTLDSELPL